MSLAGVRSNRGDGYQTAIALNWAIQMIHDSLISWIEVDSTSLDPSGNTIAVDDIVVVFKGGSTRYCQCKKNQTDFLSWDFVDLKDEIRKAGIQLARDPNGEIVFYSRNNFGEIAKLREHAQTQPDSEAFKRSLTAAMQETYGKLEGAWLENLGTSTAFSFLKRIAFETTSSVEVQRNQQIGLLKAHVTQAENLHRHLLSHLDSMARRELSMESGSSAMSSGRLNRDELLQLISEFGSVAIGPKSEMELLGLIRSASSVGRNWQRDIGKRKLARSATRDLLQRLESKPKTVLVIDSPGSGKTCLLLDVVETLEASAKMAVLFIQAREFSDCTTEDERIARGLPPDLLGVIARMAEYRHCVVLIDSLDVLSIAREHGALSYFLALIDRLEKLSNVSIVAACREFDLKYDHRLSNRAWSSTVALGPLDWVAEVIPLLHEWGVIEPIPAPLSRLLTNPRMLSIFEKIIRHGSIPVAETEQELSYRYLEAIVLRNESLGKDAMNEIEHLGRKMLIQRRVDMPRIRANLSEKFEATLLSEGVLVETAQDTLAFGHQTLLDVLAVGDADRAGESFLSFICGQPASPFVRPSIRAYFFYLRVRDKGGFAKQIRATLDSDAVAFHIKRLISESLGEVVPETEDWRLVQHLFQTSPSLFEAFYRRANSPEWLRFLRENWIPILVQNKDAGWLSNHARHLGSIKHSSSEERVGFWIEMLGFDWIDRSGLAFSIAVGLNSIDDWYVPGMPDLMSKMVAISTGKNDLLGGGLRKWVEATDDGDELLWQYIAGEITPEAVNKYQLDNRLKCGPSQFRDDKFLKRRMLASELLLDLALASIEVWTDWRTMPSTGRKRWSNEFLRATSYEVTHSRHELSHATAEVILFEAIESACLAHSIAGSHWWTKNCARLRQSNEGALRYIAIQGLIARVEENVEEIKAVLLDGEMLKASFSFEVGNLIHAAFLLLDDATQDSITDEILRLYKEDGEPDFEERPWMLMRRAQLISAIPGPKRSQLAQSVLERARMQFLDVNRLPDIESRSGTVSAPFSYERILEFSKETLLTVLGHYGEENPDARERDFFVGGAQHVLQQLTEACSRDPLRYLEILVKNWTRIPAFFREGFIEGPSKHLRFRFGNLSSSTPWEAISKPDGPSLAGALIAELERHAYFWGKTRECAQALEACAHVVTDVDLAKRMTFLLIGFETADSPDLNNDGDLVSIGINSSRGIASQAGVILANGLIEAKIELPTLLGPSLVRFSQDAHPAVPIVMLHHLPFLLHHEPKIGWPILENALVHDSDDMWNSAAQCLYFSYTGSFDRVSVLLGRLEKTIESGGGIVWGRISALAVLSGLIPYEELTTKLRVLNRDEVWDGAVEVFASNANWTQHRQTCLAGLAFSLSYARNSTSVAGTMSQLFRIEPSVEVPSSLLESYFDVMSESTNGDAVHLFEFDGWLEGRSRIDPGGALVAAEIMVKKVVKRLAQILDHEKYASALTTLFREAEDREISDDGEFLRRVIAVQDSLLQGGVLNIEEWLKSAERP